MQERHLLDRHEIYEILFLSFITSCKPHAFFFPSNLATFGAKDSAPFTHLTRLKMAATCNFIILRRLYTVHEMT
jgi:hypothetical protein